MIAPQDDVDRIMAVMEVAFPLQYGEAWTRRQISDALVLGNCHYRLVDAQGAEPLQQVPAAGFFLSRIGYEEEELLLLAVDPEYRRSGLGRILLEHLARDASQRGNRRLLLEMRRGNPAESLYRGCGFLPIGERRDYYRLRDGTRADAITFAKDIISESSDDR